VTPVGRRRMRHRAAGRCLPPGATQMDEVRKSGPAQRRWEEALEIFEAPPHPHGVMTLWALGDDHLVGSLVW